MPTKSAHRHTPWGSERVLSAGDGSSPHARGTLPDGAGAQQDLQQGDVIFRCERSQFSDSRIQIQQNSLPNTPTPRDRAERGLARRGSDATVA